jgi:hypothetical protein
MSLQTPNHGALIETFATLPAWLEATPALTSRGRFLDCDCRLGLMLAEILKAQMLPKQAVRA